jgi:exo-beta-1,3-glucanase (GH17 family)
MKRVLAAVCGSTAAIAALLMVDGAKDESKAKEGPKVSEAQGAIGASADAPFFRYLLGSPAPALVAFNPSTFDPRKKVEDKEAFRASVRADLEALRPAFDGLVFYAFNKDITPVVMKEAQKLRYRGVLLAVWDVTSEAELKGVIDLAKEYAGELAIAICIGNEGVNFNRYKPEELTAALKRVTELLGKHRSQIPLTTSEPFGQYGQELFLEFGDFLAPNIHPVFDRKDLGAKQAAEYTRERAIALAETAGKPVLVKETGFPHGGDVEKQFTPEKQEQFWAAYLREGRLAKLPKHQGGWISFAAGFEAFDMPWKVEETKIPIEGSWGLLAADRKPYPAFSVWRDLQKSGSAAAAAGPLRLRLREAHAWVVEQMDLWTIGTTICDDRGSGGQGYYPMNLAGDYKDLRIDDGCAKAPAGGLSCVEITYTPEGEKGWATAMWAYPDRPGPNWGEVKGRDITGARKLRGSIRGHDGGEVVELAVGGVNREPHHNEKLPHQDPFGPVTVRAKLSKEWQPFTIDLPAKTSLESVIGGFRCTFSKALTPNKATIYLDEVRFDDGTPEMPRLVRSYVPMAEPKDDAIRNAAFLYDNAVLLLYFLSLDDEDSLRRAKLLANAIVDAQTNDRAYEDGRWRNAYSCGPLLDQATNKARLPGIYSKEKGRMLEDRYTVSSDAGNTGWAIIALLSAHAKLEAGKVKPPYRFLNSARRAGKWLEENCRVDDALGGYSGGYEGWEKTPENPTEPVKLEWRSVEHNLDLAVAFEKLSDAVGREKGKEWLERARHARKFVFKMWNPKGNHFWVGVRDRKGTLNEDAIPGDIHTWALLALGHDPEFRTLIGWAGPGRLPRILEWVEAHCREEASSGSGYRFSDKGKGVWPEGCAHVASSYLYLGEKKRAMAVLDNLLKLTPPARPGGKNVRPAGIPAAVAGVAETGFIKEFAPGVVDKWTYPARPHLGASAWFLLAGHGTNPYWLEGPPKPFE